MKRTVLAIGAVGLAAGAIGALGLGGDTGNTGNTGNPAATTGPAPATAPVTRATLTRTQQVNGTLDYGVPVTVNGRGDGVITWLPDPGALIRRGQPLYKADNRPVPLFYGGLPLFRSLHSGDTGDDVREVEQNLAALGYTGLTVDQRYTEATAAAVRRWQKDLGRPQTGVFDPADVALAAGEVRVAAVTAHLGDRANGPALAYTGTTRTVRIALDVALQALVQPGVTARVTLPDGKVLDGTVATVGSVATAGHTANDPATIDVTVTVVDQAALGRFDQAPVAVKLVSASVANVLTVPVAALVVLPEGGYGVQVVTGTRTHSVPVELGLVGNGRVQVTGAGIAEGTLVVVPS